MEGLKKNLHRPKPIKDGRCVHHKRGQGSTSIDMTLGIVGICEMQKCGLKYDMLSPTRKVGEFVSNLDAPSLPGFGDLR